MPELTPLEWCLAIVAAAGIGFSKSGFAGVGMFHIVVYAQLFGARDSTGMLLPMLLIGDISALAAFRRHARWDYIRRLLPPALVGVVAGWVIMQWLHDQAFRPLIGGIILGLTGLQIARMLRPGWFQTIPHARWFAWSLGLVAGLTTMLANAAGPIIALYLLAVSVPKYEFVGTSAWFFLIINACKIPFSLQLGLIDLDTLAFNALLAPAIVAGLLIGRWLIHYIPQRLFDILLLLFTGFASLRLIGLFDAPESGMVPTVPITPGHSSTTTLAPSNDVLVMNGKSAAQASSRGREMTLPLAAARATPSVNSM